MAKKGCIPWNKKASDEELYEAWAITNNYEKIGRLFGIRGNQVKRRLSAMAKKDDYNHKWRLLQRKYPNLVWFNYKIIKPTKALLPDGRS